SCSVLRESEHALAEDVAEDFRGAGADTASARQQLVKLPLSLVGRPRRTGSDLRVWAQDLSGHQGQLLIYLAPVELGRRTLRTGGATRQKLGEARVAMELQRLLADVDPGDLLAEQRIAGLAPTLSERDQSLHRRLQRDVPNVGEEVALVGQGVDGHAPAFVEPTHEVLGRNVHV